MENSFKFLSQTILFFLIINFEKDIFGVKIVEVYPEGDANGVELFAEEAKVLKDFELIRRGEPIPFHGHKIGNLFWREQERPPYGFVEKDGHVIALEFHSRLLDSLPESLGNLKSLIRFSINGCMVKSLPESIGQLESLQELYLGGAYLTSLPKSFSNLKSLINLQINANRFNGFSNTLENLNNINIICQLTMNKNYLWKFNFWHTFFWF